MRRSTSSRPAGATATLAGRDSGQETHRQQRSDDERDAGSARAAGDRDERHGGREAAADEAAGCAAGDRLLAHGQAVGME